MKVMLPREQEGCDPAWELRKLYETGLESCTPPGKEAGVFILQLPLGHWLKAASRHINSPALPACPELVPRVFPWPGKNPQAKSRCWQYAAFSRGKYQRYGQGASTCHTPPSRLLLDFSFVGSCHLPLSPRKCLMFPKLQL